MNVTAEYKSDLLQSTALEHPKEIVPSYINIDEISAKRTPL